MRRKVRQRVGNMYLVLNPIYAFGIYYIAESPQ